MRLLLQETVDSTSVGSKVNATGTYIHKHDRPSEPPIMSGTNITYPPNAVQSSTVSKSDYRSQENGWSGAIIIVVCLLLLFVGLASVFVKTCLRHRRQRQEAARKAAAVRQKNEPLPGKLRHVDSYFMNSSKQSMEEVVVEMQTRQQAPVDLKRTSSTAASVPSEAPACAICLEEYEPHDIVRLLPCKHHFHQSCVDTWLDTQAMVCPMCRTDLHTVPPAHPARRLYWPMPWRFVSCFSTSRSSLDLAHQHHQHRPLPVSSLGVSRAEPMANVVHTPGYASPPSSSEASASTSGSVSADTRVTARISEPQPLQKASAGGEVEEELEDIPLDEVAVTATIRM